VDTVHSLPDAPVIRWGVTRSGRVDGPPAVADTRAVDAMRCWRTPTGEILVEGPDAAVIVLGYAIRTADGEPVTGAHEYYLLDAAGAVRRVYEYRDFASEDDVYGSTYRVVGDALVSYHSTIRAVPWAADENGEVPQSHRAEIEVSGLVEVGAQAALGADPAAVVRSALDDHHSAAWQRREEQLRPGRELRASFAAALAAHPVDGGTDLVFGYADGPVVRDPDGLVVWRPEARPAMRGKDVHNHLEDVLRERSGSLRVDLAGAPWWFWAPDE
jgi:hypothetical protein